MQVFKSQRNALLAIAAAFLYWYVLCKTIYEIKDTAPAASATGTVLHRFP